MAARLLCGIFVGGQSRRMGGHPKGLLPAPKNAADSPAESTSAAPIAKKTTTLVGRLVAIAQGLDLPVCLVGQHAEYAGLGLSLLADQPPGRGPLGGLAALLGAARETGAEGAIALSCDLPFLGPRLLARLIAAPTEHYVAAAPLWQPADRDAPIWEPLCARYSIAFLPLLQQAMAQGARSLQPILSQAGTLPLALDSDEQAQVRDWDSPDDLPAELAAALPEALAAEWAARLRR